MGTKEKLKNLLRQFFDFDLYAHSAQLSFKGKKKLTTPIGVFCTFIIVSLMISYACYKGIKLFNKTTFSLDSAIIQVPLNYTNPGIVQFNELSFDISFLIYKGLEDKYGKAGFNFVKMTD